MWNRISSYFSEQIAEVHRDRLLQIYGFFLSLIIPLTFIFWRGSLIRTVNSQVAYCWPFWPGCEAHPLRLIGESGLMIYWGICLALSFSAGAFFLLGKVKPAYIALAAAFLMKGLQQTVDYTFMGNYHYMPYVVVAALLLVPDKRFTIKILIALFYVFAGFLKLNPEWLTGAAIPDRIPWMSGEFFQLSLFYVVILELIIVWGLLSQNRLVRALSLGQFFIFHILSWYIVDYFYPLVMFSLLSLFVMELFAPPKMAGWKKVPRMSMGFIGLFLAAQMVPALAAKDTALHTHWRLTSLNMFDAAVSCHTGIYIRKTDEMIEYMPDHSKTFGIRVRCDPIIFMGEAQSLCREFAWDPKFVNIDLILTAKRATSGEYDPVLSATSICQQKGGKVDL